MNNNVEELNYQLFLENVGDIKEIKEREACKMQEKLENENSNRAKYETEDEAIKILSK